MFSLLDKTFVCGDELGPQFTRQCQIDGVINGKFGNKRKMQGFLEKPLGGRDDFQPEIKKRGENSFDGLFGDSGFKPQNVENLIKRQIRHNNVGFILEQVLFEPDGVFGIVFPDEPFDQNRSVKDDYRRESRVLRMISMESNPFEGLPYVLRNSSIHFEARIMAGRSLRRLFTKFSSFMWLEFCRICGYLA